MNAERTLVQTSRLTRRQRVAVVAPLAVIATMAPVFWLADRSLGGRVGGYLGWFVGLAVYWVFWGGVFSAWIMGIERMRALLRPRRPTWDVVAVVVFLVAMAALTRSFVPGMSYERETLVVSILLYSTPFANGLFEELLWRGVYLDVFPSSPWWRVGWATVWFGLWHIVPTATSGGVTPGMVIGPMLMGVLLAYLAKRTDSVWWPAVAHTLGGLIMVT